MRDDTTRARREIRREQPVQLPAQHVAKPGQEQNLARAPVCAGDITGIVLPVTGSVR